jgi:hypothetical protein
MPDNNNRSVTPRNSGFFQDISNRVRLIGRLVVDPRVNPIVKILPAAALVYVVFPDLLPGPIDDAVALWLGTSLFVDLCPPEVVAEHMHLLNNNPSVRAEDDVVDGEFYEPDRSTKDQNRP